MGWEHDPDTMWRAQELYCAERLSYARVAELTGVSATTLKSWGQKFQWARRREQLAQAESEIRFNTVMGRKAILERLLEAEDGKEAAQAAFAVASLENLALKRAELAATGKIPSYAEPVARPVITTRVEAVAALKQAVEGKLGMALADPGKITSATVQDIKRCLELVTELEAGLPRDDAGEQERKRGLSSDMAEHIFKAMGIAEGGG